MPSSRARIPARPAHTVDELLVRFGSEEGVVEAFVLHQLSVEDTHVLSPTWLTCCLLRRVLAKLDELHTLLKRERPFDDVTISGDNRLVVDQLGFASLQRPTTPKRHQTTPKRHPTTHRRHRS